MHSVLDVYGAHPGGIIPPRVAGRAIVSTEVASTRLPKEILREIDREAARRGISRSVYLADLIERGALREPSAEGVGAAQALHVALTSELREIRESELSLRDAMRDIQAALT